MGHQGKREFVQVLRLMEEFTQQHVHEAVREALQLGALGFDPVEHMLLCEIEHKASRLDMNLDLYPHLPQVRVQTTRSRDHLSLLPGW
ncbi:MAG: hypothetical protein OXR67_07825 [Chloroflexota bacterium]|nr:hypothetical protein [Chloroflexota bacterium]